MPRKATINLKDTIKLIAKCNVNRLPLVLELLEQSGYCFTEEAIKTAYYDADVELRDGNKVEKVTRQQALAMKRACEEHREWMDTKDMTALDLRYAYEKGVSMTELARRSGLNREQLYRYMWGVINPPQYASDRIEKALEELM